MVANNASVLGCSQCPKAMRFSQRKRDWVKCSGCGQEYLASESAVLEETTQVKRVVVKPRFHDAGERVQNYVDEVLRLNLAIGRVELQQQRIAIGGLSSPTHSAIEAARRGIVGSGNAGTKGVGFAPAREADIDERQARANPALAARYLSMTGDHRRVADAIVSDGHGAEVVEIKSGNKTRSCTLAERIGILCADKQKREKWLLAIAVGNADGAISAAGDLGEKLMKKAAEAWFAETA